MGRLHGEAIAQQWSHDSTLFASTVREGSRPFPSAKVLALPLFRAANRGAKAVFITPNRAPGGSLCPSAGRLK
eukprot:5200436-Prymnesium_polylepis.1